MGDCETLGGVCATVQQRLERAQQVLKEALPIPPVMLSMAPPQPGATPALFLLSPRISLSISVGQSQVPPPVSCLLLYHPCLAQFTSEVVHIHPLSSCRMTNSSVSSCSPQEIKASKEHQPETCPLASLISEKQRQQKQHQRTALGTSSPNWAEWRQGLPANWEFIS